MQRTLFYIPHEIAGLSIWGFGWALLALIAAVAIYLAVVRRQGGSVAEEIKANAVWWLVAAAVIYFVLPQIELRGPPTTSAPAGKPLGLAVRGYGMMMLLGVVSAVGLAIYRGRSRGISSETILGLAPWLLVFGIVGARAFYVIEYREHFAAYDAAGRFDFGSTLGHVLDFTSGGLVVYGSIIGGLLGAIIYSIRHRLNFLRLGDVVMPCLFLGMFFGRLGCLLNGCCYGDRCEDASWALCFPKGSPVYEEQLRSGEIVGLTLRADTERERASEDRPRTRDPGDPAEATATITSVAKGGLAAAKGLKVGQVVEAIQLQRPPREEVDPLRPAGDTRNLGLAMQVDGRAYYWPAEELPARARPVWPTQIISSFSNLLICLGLLAVSPFFQRDGMLVVLGFASYAVLRFGLEIIRNDEPGQFGTGLTISQLVSIGTFTGAILLLFVILRRQPRNLSPSGTGQPT